MLSLFVLFAALSLATPVAAQQVPDAGMAPPAPEAPPTGYTAAPPADAAQIPPAPPPADAAQVPPAPPPAPGPAYTTTAYAPQLVAPVPVPAESTPGFGITINPLAMVFGVFNLELELRASRAVSVFFGPQLVIAGNVTAFGATAGARFFMIGEAIEGFWISPEVGAYYASGGGASAAGFSAAGLVGYTFVWGHFVLSVGAGARYIDIGASSGGSSVSASGVGPALRVSIGAAF